ncbi:MAG: DsbA family protein [Paraglaciecola sp.]|nr:DsbA family protein [Paraglaciecola sp.]
MSSSEIAKVSIIEITDPVCSIAWGMEPKRRLLQWRYAERINWRVVTCGLIGDLSNADDWAPNMTKEIYAQGYQKVWASVSKFTGMPYAQKLQYMPMTTVIPSKVVKAAQYQGGSVRDKVLRRFREQVFIYGTPVDDVKNIESALQGISGLDIPRLLIDFNSQQLKEDFHQDWQESRSPNAYVKRLALQGIDRIKGPSIVSEGHERFALPTFIINGPCGEITIPGWRDYNELESAIEQVLPGFIREKDRTNPTPEEAFACWDSMTEQEMNAICCTTEVPSQLAEKHTLGDTCIWMNTNESAFLNAKQQAAMP